MEELVYAPAFSDRFANPPSLGPITFTPEYGGRLFASDATTFPLVRFSRHRDKKAKRPIARATGCVTGDQFQFIDDGTERVSTVDINTAAPTIIGVGYQRNSKTWLAAELPDALTYIQGAKGACLSTSALHVGTVQTTPTPAELLFYIGAPDKQGNRMIQLLTVEGAKGVLLVRPVYSAQAQKKTDAAHTTSHRLRVGEASFPTPAARPREPRRALQQFVGSASARTN